MQPVACRNLASQTPASVILPYLRLPAREHRGKELLLSVLVPPSPVRAASSQQQHNLTRQQSLVRNAIGSTQVFTPLVLTVHLARPSKSSSKNEVEPNKQSHVCTEAVALQPQTRCTQRQHLYIVQQNIGAVFWVPRFGSHQATLCPRVCLVVHSCVVALGLLMSISRSITPSFAN
jgi:hypothetical protein